MRKNNFGDKKIRPKKVSHTSNLTCKLEKKKYFEIIFDEKQQQKTNKL